MHGGPNPGVWKYEPTPPASGVAGSNGPDRKYEPKPSRVQDERRRGERHWQPLRGRNGLRRAGDFPPRGLRLARGCTGNSGLAFPFVCCLAQFAGAHTAARIMSAPRVCVFVYVRNTELTITTTKTQPQTRERAAGWKQQQPAKVEKIQTIKRRKPSSREGTTSQPAPFGVGVKAPAP